ncbi:MAG: glycosyltransferase family 2 protein [Flavonifractor plautii]
MEQPLISIIVPVYNAEPYLDNCLDSIAAQTWENLEVWLVDDGSTDASPALCDARAAADSRFHVLHQANAGVSAARNAALERATGQYLQFVDGDDYLPSTATERLVRTAGATGADLVIGRFWRVAGTRKALQGHIRRDGVFTRREFAEEMLKAPANFYYGVLWNKLYRRSIVEEGRLRCDPEVSWCEDFLFNLEYIRRARLIAATAQPVYCYVKRPGSLVATQATLARTVEMKRTMFAAYKQLYQALDLMTNSCGSTATWSQPPRTGSGLRPPALPKRRPEPRRQPPAQNRNGIMSGVLPKRCFGKLSGTASRSAFRLLERGQARSTQMGLDQAMCSSFWVTRR